MSDTITMDLAGRLVLPKPIRDRLHLKGTTVFRVAVVGERIELSPEPNDQVKLLKTGKRWVLSGFQNKTGIATAIKADRRARSEKISRAFRPK